MGAIAAMGRSYGRTMISLVVAASENNVIGVKGDLPWRLSADLKRFKAITMGKPIVMGRKTRESIGRVLPGRQNIVVTRNPDYLVEGCDVLPSLEAAVDSAAGDEVMVIGGGQVYAEALPFADRMVLTMVESEPEADTWFPEWDEGEWQEVSSRSEAPDEKNPYAYRVVELVRT